MYRAISFIHRLRDWCCCYFLTDITVDTVISTVKRSILPLIGLPLFAGSLSGCSHMTTQTKWLEVGHGLLMAADASQTIQGQNAPDCYREAGTPTADIIGTHPSAAAISGYTAAHFALRMVVADWLDRQVSNTDDDGWRWVRAAWHVGTFALEINTVRNNHREGLGVFSPGAVPQRCIDARARIGR